MRIMWHEYNKLKKNGKWQLQNDYNDNSDKSSEDKIVIFYNFFFSCSKVCWKLATVIYIT